MKTLLLMRHAKSSWKESDLVDHQRPLNNRGKRDAPRMGRLLVEQASIPQLVLSSTAIRARETANLLLQQIQPAPEIRLDRRLYHARAEDYVEVLREVIDPFDRVMLVSHNPGLENFLAVVSGSWQRMPTAAVARVRLQVDNWFDLIPGTPGELVSVWRPKEI